MDACRKLALDIEDSQHVYDDTATNNANSPLTSTSTVSTVSANGTIELSELFYINNNKHKNHIKMEVKLNADGIAFRRETGDQMEVSEQRIRMEDIIGSSCGHRMKRHPRGGLGSCRRIDEEAEPDTDAEVAPQKDSSAYLHIYAYVKNEKRTMSRERTIRILRFRSFDMYEENLRVAERWNNAIRVNQAALKHQLMQKQMLIFLNPKSGSGRGREFFQKHVLPVFNEADVPYELHVTTHSNYAREFVRKHKNLLQCYSGIIVASGDGLFFEVLNGIMERDDWRLVTQSLPIGIIPCGSGNGLARSIAHLYNEPYEPKPILYASLTCIAGKMAPMDIVRVETGKDGQYTQMYSFLSVGWGLIADVDIESERLRSIGATRFTFWSIRRLIGLRTYTGKLSYLPYDNGCGAKTYAHFTSSASSEKRRLSTEVQEFHDIPNPPEDSAEPDIRADADLEEGDKFLDAISLDRASSQPHVNSWHSACSRRTAYYSLSGPSVRSRRSVLTRLETVNLEYESRQPPTTIPPLDTAVPADTWRTEEGEYVMIHAAYTTHLGSDCFFAPKSRLNDGIIYLVIIRGGARRSQVANFLMSMSSGTHLPKEPNPYIEVVPVRAFRIEPATDKEGIITVDGERVNYGPVQGEILSGMINVMVPNGNAIE